MSALLNRQPYDYGAVAHRSAPLPSVCERQPLLAEAYAQSHLSGARDWFQAPAGMVLPPTPPETDDATADIWTSVALLSRKLAAAAPINRVPPEILLEIFYFLKAIHEDDGHHAHFWTVQPTRFVPWPEFSHVCRTWRHIICNSALLWRDIHVEKGLHWLELCLLRSRETPLRVFFHSSATLPSSIDMLSPHTHRIKVLVVFDSTPDILPRLVQFFQPAMPMLEEFCLDAETIRNEAACLGDENILTLVPALHTLRLGYAHVDWTSSIARNLRVLHLRDWTPPDKHLLSLDGFLRALQEFKALEDLHIDFAFPFETYTEDGVREVSGPIISLPSIRKLYFLCPAHEEPSSPDIFHLLAHFKVPLSASLEIYCQVDDCVTFAGEGGYLDTIPQDANCLPILHRAQKAELYDFGFNCHCGDGNFSFQEEEVNRMQRVWAYTVELAVRDFCTLFAKSPMQELTLKEMKHTKDTWVHLFQTFSSLSVLVVEGKGQANSPRQDGLLAALTPPTHHATDSDSTVVLPKLRTLQFKVKWREDTLRDLVRCLRRRTARGVKLRVLNLHMFGRVKGDTEVNARHKALLDQLKTVVEGKLMYVDIPRSR